MSESLYERHSKIAKFASMLFIREHGIAQNINAIRQGALKTD